MTDSQPRSMKKIMLKAPWKSKVLDAIQKWRWELKSKDDSVSGLGGPISVKGNVGDIG